MSSRQLGLGMATALVVGNTIGMGIFMQPAALAPFGLNALTGWAAVIIGCVCLALCFAALARKLPQADGPFGYVRATLGESLAFPALWSYWISCWVTLPVLAIGSDRLFPECVSRRAGIAARRHRRFVHVDIRRRQPARRQERRARAGRDLHARRWSRCSS